MNAHGSWSCFNLHPRYYFSDSALALFIFSGNSIEAKLNHITALMHSYFITADV